MPFDVGQNVRPFRLSEGDPIVSFEYKRKVTTTVTLDSTCVWPPGEMRSTRIPAGVPVGMNSNTSKWHVIRGAELSATEAAAQTVLSVDYPERFVVGDNVKIVSANALTAEENLGAVTNVGASTITVTSGLTNEHYAGDYIYVSPATDYDQDVAVGILNVSVDMLDPTTAAAADKVMVEITIGHDGGSLYDAVVMEESLGLFGKARRELESRFGRVFVDDAPAARAYGMFTGVQASGNVVVGGALDVTGATTLDGAVTLGDASTDVITCTGRLLIRQVNDGGMDATPGTEGEIVYNLADDKVYICTATHGTAATFALVGGQSA